MNLTKFQEKNLVFIPFFVSGFPSYDYLEKLIKRNKKYIDILELGIPFSDPVADGPVLEEVNYEAIKRGVTLEKTLDWLSKNKIPQEIPTVFLLYLNTIYDDLEKKLKDIKEVGVKGLVIPDLPLEEAENLMPIFKKYQLDLVLFLSPTTRVERRKKILELAESFIYCISVKGVTGERDTLPEEGLKFVKEVRKETEKPLVWGFGVNKKEHIESLKGLVNGVIVGSAFAKRMLEGKDIEDYLKELSIVSWV